MHPVVRAILQAMETFKGKAYFDGTGDYLSGSVGSDFEFGTGDFTVETKINVISDKAYGGVFAFAPSASDYNFFIEYSDARGFCTYTGATFIQHVLTTKKNQDVYLTISRKSGTLYMFENSTLVKSVANSVNMAAPIAFVIGRPGVLTNDYYMNMYTHGIRVTKGVGRYDNITAPDNPEFTVDSANVKFCMRFAESLGATTFIDDTGKTVTTNGNVVIVA